MSKSSRKWGELGSFAKKKYKINRPKKIKYNENYFQTFKIGIKRRKNLLSCKLFIIFFSFSSLSLSSFSFLHPLPQSIWSIQTSSPSNFPWPKQSLNVLDTLYDHNTFLWSNKENHRKSSKKNKTKTNKQTKQINLPEEILLKISPSCCSAKTLFLPFPPLPTASADSATQSMRHQTQIPFNNLGCRSTKTHKNAKKIKRNSIGKICGKLYANAERRAKDRWVTVKNTEIDLWESEESETGKWVVGFQSKPFHSLGFGLLAFPPLRLFFCVCQTQLYTWQWIWGPTQKLKLN